MNYTQKLRDLGACDEAVSYAQRCESARIDTLNALWRSGRPDWILWLAARVLPGDRRVVRAASVCARAVLHLSREQDRPVLAQTLDLVDRWCAGESVSATELRASAAWAWATATEAEAASAAEAAARAARAARAAEEAAEAAARAARAARAAEEAASAAARAARATEAASAAWAWATATEAASAAAWAEADDSIDFLAAIDSVLPLADVVAAFEVHR